MQRLLFLALFSLTISAATAQNSFLSGFWKGYMTQGKVGDVYAAPFELYLEVKGNKLIGRSYLYKKNGEIIEMKVDGHIYYDRSISLAEVKFIPLEGANVETPYHKQYQLVYNRSIFDTDNTLDGYWQQIIESSGVRKKQWGKLSLRKQKMPKSGKA